MADTPVTIVHLVRASNGFGPFEAFISSFREFPPGTRNELVLAMKGFGPDDDVDQYRRRVADLDTEMRFVPDDGLDLTVYFSLALELARERYCFLNSFSRVQAPDWLAHLAAALDHPDVGLVGASGMWGSGHSYMHYRWWLPSPYRDVFPDRRNVWEQFRAIESDRTGAPPPSLLRRRVRIPFALRDVVRQTLWFPLFPAAHVRTNAFVIDASTLDRLRIPVVRNKFEAYRLESGRRSLTRQVQQLGLRAQLVDRQGRSYDVEDWARSATFWQGRQEGLLVADNQTDTYQNGSAARRSVLSRFAWASEAAPTDP
ncbi:MAG: hypothetical protein M0Z95_23050 [Actinomycetota bacterium]|jgi:hypothetical protein|nr:hypothetical protein [Actinomycetota bacterium]